MPNNVDDKIVRMQFDNKNFEKNVATTMQTLNNLKASLKFEGVSDGIAHLGKSIKNVSFDSIQNGIHQVTVKIPIMGTVLDQTIRNMTNAVTGFVKKTISEFSTLGAIKSGFSEYETQINAVQTILANTESKGTTIDDVNQALDTLNTYADKTIYNFTEMTRNIGTFTAAGVDLQTSVDAIQGIANLAAVSGSNSQQASRAMYQLSQALASGKVNLQDWNSVVNAGMGGQVFQDALKNTAKHMGIVVDESVSFRESISSKDGSGWLTSDVLLETLKQFAGAFDDATLKTQGYTESEIADLHRMAETAENAATKVKTFTQLIDTLKESMQSGWTQSWEYILGDFEEARSMWTKVSDSIAAMIQPAADARNEMLRYWAEGEAVPVEKVEEKQKELWDLVQRTMSGEFGNGQKRFDTYKALGFDPKEVQAVVDDFVAGTVKGFEDIKTTVENPPKGGGYKSFFDDMTGREAALAGLRNIFTALVNIMNRVRAAFREIFPRTTGQQLTDISKKFYQLSATLLKMVNSDALDKIQRAFRGLFAAFKLIKNILSGLISGIGSLFEALGFEKAGSVVLDLAANIGDLIYKLNNFVEESGIAKDIFETVGTAIGKAIRNIIDLFSKLGDMIAEKIDFSKITDFFTNLSFDPETLKKNLSFDAIINVFKNTYDSIAENTKKIKEQIKSYDKMDTTSIKTFSDNAKESFSGFTAILDVCSTVSDKLTNVWNTIKKVFGAIIQIISPIAGNIADKMIDITGAFDLDKYLDYVQKGGMVALILYVNKIGKSLNKAIKNAGKVAESLTTLFASVTKAINNFSTAIKGVIVEKIAKSILMLAGGLLILSLIPTDKLWSAVGSLATIFLELSATLKIVDKANLKGVATTVMALGFGILTLVGAIAILANIDTGTVYKGIGRLGWIFIELIAIITTIAKGAAGKLKGAAGLIMAIATAVNMLVVPIILLGVLPLDLIMKGIGMVTIIIAELVGAFNLSKLGGISENLLKAAAVILSLAFALNMLMVPVLIFAGLTAIMKDGVIWEVLGMIGTLLGELTAALDFSKLGDPNSLKGVALSMMGIAFALDMMMVPVITIAMILSKVGGNLSDQITALGMIIGSIGVLMYAMTETLTTLADGLKGADLGVILANILVLGTVLAGLTEFVIKPLSEMTIDEVLQSVMGMAAMTATLVLAILALSDGLKDADLKSILTLVAAMAAIIIILVQTVIIPLADMDSDSLGMALLGIVVIVAAVVGGIYLLAKAMNTLSVGSITKLQVVGGTMLSFAVTLILVAGAVALIIAAIGALNEMDLDAENLFENVKIVGESIALFLVSLVESSLGIFTALGETVLTWLSEFLPMLCGFLLTNVPLLVNTVFNILTSILDNIITNIIPIVEKVVTLFCTIFDAIIPRIGEIVKRVVDMFCAIIENIAWNLGKIVDSMIFFIHQLACNIGEKADEIAGSIWALFKALVDAVVALLTDNALPSLAKLGKKIIATVVGFIIDGINNMINFVFDKIETLINGAIGVINKLGGNFGNVSIPRPQISTPGWVEEWKALAAGGTLTSGTAIVGEAGPELLSNVYGKTQVTPLTHQNTRSVLDGYVYKIDNRLADISTSLRNIDTGFNSLFSTPDALGYDDTGLRKEIGDVKSSINTLKDSIEGMAVIIDGKALVGQIAKPMDRALGIIAARR